MTAGHMRDPDFGILYAGIKTCYPIPLSNPDFGIPYAGIKNRDHNWNQNLGLGVWYQYLHLQSWTKVLGQMCTCGSLPTRETTSRATFNLHEPNPSPNPSPPSYRSYTQAQKL